MSAWATTPVLIPLTTAVLLTLVRRNAVAQQVVSAIGMGALWVCALVLLLRVNTTGDQIVFFGGWAKPFAIEFTVDPTSAALVMVTALMGLATLLFMSSDADTATGNGVGRHPLLLPLQFGMLAGVGGVFVTADLFNLYVWFEIILICTLGLLVIGGRTDQLDAGFKYLVLNLPGTLLLLVAVGAVYAVTGHLNFGALNLAAPAVAPGLLLPVLMLLSMAFLIKAGAFPLYAWLPASYHTLPAPVLALVAGLLTKAGVYAVLRTLGDVFTPAPALLYEALGWLAAATMLFGVLGAAYHWDMRRILAFHIISQVGYILLGIALATEAGYAASLFYTIHHIIVKANLFLVAAIIWRLTGSYDLRRIGGLYVARPWLTLLLLIPAFSLVGIPPLSGFWAKLLILQETIAQERVVWTVIALLVSILTLYSMVKLWMEAFWKRHPAEMWQPPDDTRLGPAWIATIGLATVTLMIGLYPQPLLVFVKIAAAGLGGN
ncbi:MAG: proton-conducting transporter membrane subunit [Thiolinea sp.]